MAALFSLVTRIGCATRADATRRRDRAGAAARAAAGKTRPSSLHQFHGDQAEYNRRGDSESSRGEARLGELCVDDLSQRAVGGSDRACRDARGPAQGSLRLSYGTLYAPGCATTKARTDRCAAVAGGFGSVEAETNADTGRTWVFRCALPVTESPTRPAGGEVGASKAPR